MRAPTIQALAESGSLQPSLLKPAPAKAGDRDMGEITAPEYPGERLIVCRNRDLAVERARKREALLAATETDLTAIARRRRAQAQTAARHR
jgi:hypothetical protein